MRTTSVGPYGSQICLQMEQRRSQHGRTQSTKLFVCLLQAISFWVFYSFNSFLSSLTQLKKTNLILRQGSSAGRGGGDSFDHFLLLKTLGINRDQVWKNMRKYSFDKMLCLLCVSREFNTYFQCLMGFSAVSVPTVLYPYDQTYWRYWMTSINRIHQKISITNQLLCFHCI